MAKIYCQAKFYVNIHNVALVADCTELSEVGARECSWLQKLTSYITSYLATVTHT